MEVKPDKKLLVKQWYVLLTVSLVLVLFALALQLLIPLKPGVTANQVAPILWSVTLGIIVVIWGISAPILILWIKNLSYYIEDDRITIHKGILTKIQQNIPYRSITDFMLHRSLYDRILGIGSIRIQTAGQGQSAGGYEGQLSGLVQGDDLLQQLRGNVRGHRIAASTTVAEDAIPSLNEDRLQQILEELRLIRGVLEESSKQ